MDEILEGERKVMSGSQSREGDHPDDGPAEDARVHAIGAKDEGGAAKPDERLRRVARH
jgi:hypothetical protein